MGGALLADSASVSVPSVSRSTIAHTSTTYLWVDVSLVVLGGGTGGSTPVVGAAVGVSKSPAVLVIVAIVDVSSIIVSEEAVVPSTEPVAVLVSVPVTGGADSRGEQPGTRQINGSDTNKPRIIRIENPSRLRSGLSYKHPYLGAAPEWLAVQPCADARAIVSEFQ